jgi:hypothetical protein
VGSFLRPVVFSTALLVLAGCEDPYSGQVMCWQDNTVNPPEVICVPLRSMHGLAVPEGAFIVGGGDGGSVGPTPSIQPTPPGPTNILEYTALSVDGPNVAVEVDEDGRVQSTQAGNGTAVAFDSADPGSGQTTQDVFDDVGAQLEGAGLVNPFSQ